MNIKRLALAALLALPAAVHAQGSSSPIRIVVGFPPGGNIDFVGRTLAQEVSAQIDRTVILDSKPGAGGAIAAETVARANPDGSTLLLVSSANAILPALNKNLRYDPLADFEWIGTFTRYPLVVTVAANSPISSLADLVKRAKEAPDRLSYGSAGIGSAPHLAAVLLAQTIQAKVLHVAYKGEIPALVGLLGSQVDFTVNTVPTALPRIKAGELKALAVTSSSRWPALPDVPTVAESGYPSYEVNSWVGLAAPKGTPAAEVARLNKAFDDAKKNPEVRNKIESTGGQAYSLTPNQTRELMQREIKQWQERVADAGITPE